MADNNISSKEDWQNFTDIDNNAKITENLNDHLILTKLKAGAQKNHLPYNRSVNIKIF